VDPVRAIDNVKILLLNTAKEVIRDEGLLDFNIRTIAKRAGVSVGTVYNSYPSKSELVFETMESLLRECVSYIKKDSGTDLFAEFREIYFAILGYFGLFKGDIMDDLAALATSKDKPQPMVRQSHMMIFKETFFRILQTHQSEIDPVVFERFGIDKIIEMILTLFTTQLRKGEKNYELIDYILRQTLARKP